MSRLNYTRAVYNKSGYVLFLPDVGAEEELLCLQNPINPYVESLTQQFPLGSKIIKGESGWQYVKNAAVALGIAVPTQGAAAPHAEFDNDIVVGAVAAIGALTVTLTSTANLSNAPLSTKDGFKDGFLIVNDGTGEGQGRKIKGHEAAQGTSNFIVTLYDPLTIALAITSEVGLIQHPCANVVATKAVMTNVFTGIPLIPITASYYFWAQMQGPTPVVTASVNVKGTKIIVGTVAAVAGVAVDVTTEVVIGYPLTLGQTTDTEYMIVNLQGNW